MTNKKPKFSKLEMVHVKGDPKKTGYIWGNAIPSDNGWQYEVMFSAADRIIFSEEDLVPIVKKIKFGNATDLLRSLLLIKLKNPLSDHLYGARSSRTEFHVYQFKPALKFLNNPDQRILIADEVGLGKTIEAGIIYLELQARLDIARVLVVCPPSLTYKWQDEMRSRFDEKFTIMDRDALENFFDEYEHYGDSTRLRGIVTLHLIRRAEFAAQLAEKKINFDLVIFDEAHHLRNPSTLSNGVASVISENTDAMLFLTATPLHLGNQDLFHLLQILSPGEFDNLEAFEKRILPNQFINFASQLVKKGDIDAAYQQLRQLRAFQQSKRLLKNPYYLETLDLLKSDSLSKEDFVRVQKNLLELNTLSHIFTRTRKREVMIDAPVRVAHSLKIKFTPEEDKFYRNVIKFVKGEYKDRLGNWVSGWATVMRERQAASCISAIRKKFSQELKDEYQVTREEVLEISNLSKDDDVDLSTYESAIKEVELPLFKKEPRIKRLESLVKIGDQIKGIDTKFDVFHQALLNVLEKDPTSKILVFAFFRGTLDYLHRKLQDLGFGVQIIHGDIRLEERKSNVQLFRDNENINILLSSEVGSEGLDFQFCNTIFNYDLPWNPMKVEQRIGRLDRFGQKHKRINIYNLIIENSIEERIFLRLYERIGIFEAAVGDLEAILGEEIRKISKEIFSTDLTPQQEIYLAEQAAVNIVRQQQDLEEFEEERQRFMGQDMIFGDEIEDAMLEGRYISGNEINALVDSFTTQAFSKKCLKSDPEDPTCFLNVTDEFQDYMRRFVFKNYPSDQSSQSFLRRINHSHGIPVTFSNEVAYERKLVEFINFRHPLTRAALHFWNEQAEDDLIFKFKIQREEPPFGVYYFFIFRLHFEGLNKKIQLAPVVVDCSSYEIQKDISKELLTLIQSLGHNNSTRHLDFKENDFERAREAAISYMANQRDDAQAELEKMNNSLIDARMSALDQTYEVKSTRVKKYLEEASDPRIIRMRRAQLRNIESTYLNKYEEIDKARNCSVSYQLEISGILYIVRENNL